MPAIGPGYVRPSPFAKLGQTPGTTSPILTALGAPPPVTPVGPPSAPGAGYYDYGAQGYGPTGPAYTPPAVDYASLIQSMLAPLQQEAKGMTAADKAALLAQQRRAIIQFGEAIPGSNVGKEALGSALQNTRAGLSITARVNQAHLDAIRQLTNTLAARGLLRSGETGYQTGREQQAYGTAQYDARQKVLDYLSGIQSAYDQAQQQRQWALAQAAMSAAQSVPQYPVIPPSYGYPPPYQTPGPQPQPQAPPPQPAPPAVPSYGGTSGPGLIKSTWG
ncbi:MAG TPA: hypothetical protein VIV12_31645 [Streptosporangiaceae bacterium]